MKNVIPIIACLIFFFSCTDNPTVKAIREIKDMAVNTKNVVKEMAALQEDIVDLSQIKPLTNEELKSWLPEQLDGMRRSSYKAGAMGMMQVASLEATFERENKSEVFKIEIIDGAGEVGAIAIAGLRILLTQAFEEDSDYKLRRSTTKNGVKVIEELQKNNNMASVMYLHDGRFYVNATGTNMDISTVWKMIDKLNLNKLG